MSLDATHHLLQAGQEIDNKWVVERFLGEGAFAEVYRVNHKVFGRQAMKVLRRVGLSLQEVEDLLHEAIMLANINHPNIIRVFDAGTINHRLGAMCFFTTEYADGGTLDSYWRAYANQFMPVEKTVSIITQVVDGLCVAHSQSPAVVHRDITPQNILLSNNEAGLVVKVADFGLAKKLNPLTQAMTGLGTRAFKPPEVLADTKNDSPAGDVWAIGTCLYLLLADVFPFMENFELDNPGKERFANALKPPGAFNIQVPTALDTFVLKCLAVDSSQRFQTAMEMREALSTLSLGSPSDDIQATVSETTLAQIHQAIELARDVSMLTTAADLLEHALRDAPQLRATFESKITLWRKGISG